MTKEQALTLWDTLFDGKDIAFDYASHEIHKEDYMDNSKGFGWDVELKQPIYAGGSMNSSNLAISAILTKTIRDGKTSFRIGNFQYQVRKGKRFGTFEIYDVTDRNAPVSMEPCPGNQDRFYNDARRKKSLEQKKEYSSASDFLSDFLKGKKQNNVPLFKAAEENEQPEIRKETEIVPEASEEVKQEEKTLTVSEEKEPEEENQVLEPTEPVIEEKTEDEASLSDATEQPETPEETKTETVDLKEEPEEVQTESSEEEKTEEDEAAASVLEEKNEEPECVPVPEETSVSEPEKPEEEKESVNQAFEETEHEEVTEPKEEPSSVSEEQETETSANPATTIANNEKFEYERPQETLATKETIVQYAEPIVAVTFNDNEADFIKTEPFKEENYGGIGDRAEAIESLSDAKFVEDAKEVDSKIVSEHVPEVEGIEKTASTEFETERKEEEQVVENVEEKAVEETEEENKAEEAKKEEEKETEIAEYKPEISEYIGDDDDETIVIPENSFAPTKDTDISGLLLKIDSLKKLVYTLESEQKKTRQRMNELSDAFETEKRKSSTAYQNNDQLNERLREAAVAQARLEEERNNLKALLDQNEKELNTRETEISSLKERLSSATEELSRSSTENRNKDTMIISLNEIKNVQANQYEEMTKRLSDASVSLVDAQKKNKELEEQNQIAERNNDELSKKNDDLAREKEGLENEVRSKEDEILNLNQNIDNLNNDIQKYKRYMVLKDALIDEDSFDACQQYLRDNSLFFSYDNVLASKGVNPQWERRSETRVVYHPIGKEQDEIPLEDMSMSSSVVEEADVSYLTKDIERKKHAFALFEEIFKDDPNNVTDFAGREIRLDDYKNQDRKFGWDYIVLDPTKPDTEDNVIIANLKSLADFKEDGEFMTNGHHFQVIEKDAKKVLTSRDFIIDPYNFSQAMDIVDNESRKPVPLVYIFVKFTGIRSEVFPAENQLKFNDIIERTVKRCCPKSYLQTQTIKDYTFILFDGSVDGVFKEVYHYTILLNSYRYAFKKSNLLNAIIVLDKFEAPISMSHLTFDQIINDTNDPDLIAVKYFLNNVTVVDSLIKRGIHVGPQIFDDLNLTSQLVQSKIGEGQFAIAYQFHKHFYEIPYIFPIMKK